MQLARVQGTSLVLLPEALARISSSHPPNTRYVAGSGSGRVGKSTLLDAMLHSPVFQVSNTTEPCTYGIHLSDPVRLPDGTHMVCVDSEGTHMGDTSQQGKILTLVYALTSGGGVMMHNERSYADSGIATIAMLASAKQHITGLRNEESPALILVLRNFDLQLTINQQPTTPAQFLEHVLSNRGDANDHDRQVVRDSFPSRTMHTLPVPSQADLAHIEALPQGEFKTAVDGLHTAVLAMAQPKRIGGAVCDGPMLVAYLEECVRKINEESTISIQSAVESATNVFCSRCADEAFNTYKNSMAATVQSLSGNDAALQSAHNNARAQSIATYTARTQGVHAASVARYAVAGRIDAEHNMYAARNATIRETKAREAAEQARREAEERARREREAAAYALRQQQEADQRAREQARAREEADRRAREEQARIAEANRRAQEEAARQAELQRQAAEAAAAANRRNNSTHLNSHGFRISGTRIW